jgi:hypothetical protein
MNKRYKLTKKVKPSAPVNPYKSITNEENGKTTIYLNQKDKPRFEYSSQKRR